MNYSDPSSTSSNSSTSTGNPQQDPYMSSHSHHHQQPPTFGHYQPPPTNAMMSSMPPNSYHPDHPSVFQSSGSHTRQHSGLVPAPPGSYSSSYNYPPPHSASYLSSPSLDGAQDSKDNLNLLGQSSSSHSSDTSQPASPNYPPGMNPNEHRKSFESAADIKHRRRTTKSQFQTLETTFQRDFKPTSQTRQQLATQLGMEPRAVQIWFQNRRAKAKATAKREEAIARGEPIEFPVHGGKVSDRAPKSKAVLASLMKRAEEVKEARRLSESQGGAGPSGEREVDELDSSEEYQDAAKLQRHLANARASTGSVLSTISPTSSTFSDRSQRDGGYGSAHQSSSHLPTLTSLYSSGGAPYRFGTAQSEIPTGTMGEGGNEDERSRSSTISHDFSNSSAWQSRRPSAMSAMSSATSNCSHPSYIPSGSYGGQTMSMHHQPPGNSYSRLAQGGESYSDVGGAGMHYHSSSYPSYSSLPQSQAYGQPDYSNYGTAARYRSIPNLNIPPGFAPGSYQQPQPQRDQDLGSNPPSLRHSADAPSFPSNFDAEIRRVSCPDNFSTFSDILPMQSLFLTQDHFDSNLQEDNGNLDASKRENSSEMCQDFIQGSNIQFPHPTYLSSSLIGVGFSKMVRGERSLEKESLYDIPLPASFQNTMVSTQDNDSGEEFLEESEMIGDDEIKKGEGEKKDLDSQDFLNSTTPSFEQELDIKMKQSSSSPHFSEVLISSSHQKEVQSPSPTNTSTSHSVKTPE